MLQEDSGALSLDRVLRARLADRQAWSQPALALDDLFDIALQLCAALEAVHLQGLIHKDINPSNLLWHGERRQLQLIDFGIASELASPANWRRQTLAAPARSSWKARCATWRRNRPGA